MNYVYTENTFYNHSPYMNNRHINNKCKVKNSKVIFIFLKIGCDIKKLKCKNLRRMIIVGRTCVLVWVIHFGHLFDVL